MLQQQKKTNMKSVLKKAGRVWINREALGICFRNKSPFAAGKPGRDLSILGCKVTGSCVFLLLHISHISLLSLPKCRNVLPVETTQVLEKVDGTLNI